jgi:hypothetical protein
MKRLMFTVAVLLAAVVGVPATPPLSLTPLGYVLYPEFPITKPSAELGRLNVSTATGDVDGDGDFDRVDVFGGRSISIRDTHGRLVWDSGDALERLARSLSEVPTLPTTLFNTTNTANDLDNRSDDKSIEPESVVLGRVRGVLYAFVGLERTAASSCSTSRTRPRRRWSRTSTIAGSRRTRAPSTWIASRMRRTRTMRPSMSVAISDPKA